MSLLNTIKTQKERRPLVCLIYGVHGIGKTSLAASAESPIFIGVEENSEFDVARFPKVKKWEDLIAQLKTIRDEKHDFKTIVIDTIDGLEEVAQGHILSMKSNEGKTMATAFGGYGKAYEKMADMFVEMRDEYLVKIRDNGMQVIILAHSSKEKFEDPILAIAYDTYSTAMHKKIKHIFEDWASMILFANYDLIRAENAQGKEYAESVGGRRVIYTEERPSHVAKNRYGLPPVVDFPAVDPWKSIKRLVVEYFKKPEEEKAEIDLESIKKEAESLFEKITDDAIAGSVKKSLNKAKTADDYNRLIEKMKSL